MPSLLLNPLSQQTQAIARCFEAAGRGDEYVFGHIDDVGQLYTCTPDAKNLKPITTPKDEFVSVIPTGSLDTSRALSHLGPITLGQVTMAPSSLNWLNKPWSLEFAQSAGIQIPQTWHSVDDIPNGSGRIFFKPGLEGVPGPRSWVETVDQIPDYIQQPDSGFVFQEMIGGLGVKSYAFLADRGRIIAGVGLHERLCYPPDGGSAALMDIEEDRVLQSEVGTLLAASNYSGWGLAEFKFCPQREKLYFMEINPKFWASIELTLRTQPEFAKLLFNLDVLPEPFTRMVWSGRYLRTGINNWPRHIAKVKRAERAKEPLQLNDVILGALPSGLQKSIREYIRRSSK